ncbi:hypothetical protein BGP_0827 [Beggiatoa sp. PS]|nr:hypothetical protein BGP_0827 [Beggiatoa sp. PS]
MVGKQVRTVNKKTCHPVHLPTLLGLKKKITKLYIKKDLSRGFIDIFINSERIIGFNLFSDTIFVIYCD